MEAAISPDASQIVFVSDRDKTRALYLASATAPGSEWKRLTTGKGHYARPVFARDATRVTAQFSTDSREPALPRAFPPSIAPPSGAGEMTFVTYANARFHYVVDVPDHFIYSLTRTPEILRGAILQSDTAPAYPPSP